MIFEEVDSIIERGTDGLGDCDGYGEAYGLEWFSSLEESVGYGNGTAIGYGFLIGSGSGSVGGVNNPEFD